MYAGKEREVSMHFTICRKPGAAAISLDEWTAFISSSPMLKPAPSKEGINPFTKKPTLFHPAPGSAYFDGTGGRCSLGFNAGTISGDCSDEDFGAVTELADALHAVVEKDEGEDETAGEE